MLTDQAYYLCLFMYYVHISLFLMVFLLNNGRTQLFVLQNTMVSDFHLLKANDRYK